MQDRTASLVADPEQIELSEEDDSEKEGNPDGGADNEGFVKDDEEDNDGGNKDGGEAEAKKVDEEEENKMIDEIFEE